MDFEKWMLNKAKPSGEAHSEAPHPPASEGIVEEAAPTPIQSEAPVDSAPGKATYFLKDQDSSGDVNEIVVSTFDPGFYKSTYRDLPERTDNGALEHFWHVGWLEGRNPNSWFNTSSYLEMNEDVRIAGVNPFMHYIGWGRKEGRLFRTPIPIRQINQTLFNDPDLDWFALVAPVFDRTFYASQFDEPIPPNLSLLAHYLYRGWKENRLPRASHAIAAKTPPIGELAYFVPPLVIELFAERAPPVLVRKTRSRPAEVSRTPEEAPVAQVLQAEPMAKASPDIATGMPVVPARRQLIELEYRKTVVSVELAQRISNEVIASNRITDVSRYNDQMRDIAVHFDVTFYLAANQDVDAAGVDPVEHYFYTGWLEGRDPAPWFSTSYYLSSNPDVAEAQINPFWHYLVAGKAEQRAPRKQGGARSNILATIRTPEQRVENYSTPKHARLKKRKLKQLIGTGVAERDSLVWSSSHDCYPISVGGTQIFIADEERLFRSKNVAYIHASPLRGSLLMNNLTAEETLTRLVINGEIVGVATDAEIAEVLAALDAKLPADRTYVVHSVLGHSLPGMLAIHAGLKPTDAFFWLHDYGSLCSGYNLLRNDIEYCHSPPVGSQACNVCIFGQSRTRHLNLVTQLFDGCDFTVVAPSDVTLSIWKNGSQLRHKSSIVLEHCAIDNVRTYPDPRPVEAIGMLPNPVKVAFVGYPTSHKGWPIFEELVEKTKGQGGYQFFHFAKLGSLALSDNITAIRAEVTSDQRHAMTDLLAAHGIDLVVMAAPWPETFSYALFEALAAGCDVITLPNSGNIAAVVRNSGRGFVFESEPEIIDFFQSYAAVSYVRARARYGIERGQLVHKGTTAAVHSKTVQGA